MFSVPVAPRVSVKPRSVAFASRNTHRISPAPSMTVSDAAPSATSDTFSGTTARARKVGVQSLFTGVAWIMSPSAYVPGSTCPVEWGAACESAAASVRFAVAGVSPALASLPFTASTYQSASTGTTVWYAPAITPRPNE